MSSSQQRLLWLLRRGRARQDANDAMGTRQKQICFVSVECYEPCVVNPIQNKHTLKNKENRHPNHQEQSGTCCCQRHGQNPPDGVLGREPFSEKAPLHTRNACFTTSSNPLNNPIVLMEAFDRKGIASLLNAMSKAPNFSTSFNTTTFRRRTTCVKLAKTRGSQFPSSFANCMKSLFLNSPSTRCDWSWFFFSCVFEHCSNDRKDIVQRVANRLC